MSASSGTAVGTRVQVSPVFNTSSTEWSTVTLPVWFNQAGTFLLGFAGLNSGGGDETVVLDNVQLMRYVSEATRTFPDIREVSSREASFFIEGSRGGLLEEVVSREVSFTLDAVGTPPPVLDLAMTVSPTGETVTVDWSRFYDPWAVRDVAAFHVYQDAAPFDSVAGRTPTRIVPADTLSTTFTGLPLWKDSYYAVVAVDALGNAGTEVVSSGAYVLMPEVVSREASFFVGDGPNREVISRETSLLVDNPGPPVAVGRFLVMPSANGDSVTLDWSSYNSWQQKDVVQYRVYYSDRFISDLEGIPWVQVPGETFRWTFNGLTPWMDHFFAVIPVDGLGNSDPGFHYQGAYVLMPEVVSREAGVFVGDEPIPPYREVISREASLVVADAVMPAPVTGITSGFLAGTSRSRYGAIDIDWTAYAEEEQRDVLRYRLYVSDGFFTNVTGMAWTAFPDNPDRWDGRRRSTLEGLAPAQIHYVAVVAEDASGQFNPNVYSISAKASIGSLGDVRNLVATSNGSAWELRWEVGAVGDNVEDFLSDVRLYISRSTAPLSLGALTRSYMLAPLLSADGASLRVSTVDAFGTESPGVTLELTAPQPFLGTNAVFDELTEHVQDLLLRDGTFPISGLTVRLISGPSGLVVVDGMLRWTPSEAQGPSTNAVLIEVGDGLVSRTNLLTLAVREVNELPSLPGATNLTINEVEGLAQELAPLTDYASTLSGYNPLAYWRLNETTQPPAADVAVNSGSLGDAAAAFYQGASVHPVAGALAGSTDSASSFDGSGGTMAFGPYLPALNIPAPFTIEAWLNPAVSHAAGSGTLTCAISSGQFAAPRSGWLIYQSDTGWNFRTYNQNGTATSLNITAGPAPFAGVWYHVVATYDGTRVKMYVDGQLSAEGTPTGYVPGASGGFAIGGRADSSFHWNGAADEVAIYPSALSATDIAAHYANGTSASPSAPYQTLVQAKSPIAYFRLGEPTYTAPAPTALPSAVATGSLGTGANGSYNPGLRVGAEGPKPPAFSGFSSANSAPALNGSAGFVGTPVQLNDMTEFTMTGWVKHGAVKSSRGGYFGQNDLLEFGDANGGASVELWVNARGGSIIAPYPFADNEWGQFVVTGTTTNTILYANGREIGRLSGTIETYGTSAFFFNIGGGGIFNATGDMFRGSVDEVAVLPLALSPEQVVDLYTKRTVLADPDIPVQSLTVTLLSGPTGLVVTNGVLAWTPTEAQGPSTNAVVVTVSDGVGTTTNTFAITVREVNVLPTLEGATNATINELLGYMQSLAPADVDVPVQPLTVTLLSGPTGLVVTNGVLAWTPTEAQGPSTNAIVVAVTDGVGSVTNSFSVVVREVNALPSLAGATNATINELVGYTQSLVPQDSDIPVQFLTVTLLSGPTGLVVTNGVLAWTPTEAQGPSTNAVLVTVGDGVGTTTNSFVIAVREVNTLPRWAAIPDGVGEVGKEYVQRLEAVDEDLPAQLLTFRLLEPIPGAFVESALFRWTPVAAQAGTTNRIRVIASDGVASVESEFLIRVVSITTPPAFVGIPELVEDRLRLRARMEGALRLEVSDNLTDWREYSVLEGTQGSVITTEIPVGLGFKFFRLVRAP